MLMEQKDQVKFIQKMFKGKAFKGDFRKLVESYLEGGDWLFAVKLILKELKQSRPIQTEAVALALFIASESSSVNFEYDYSLEKDILQRVNQLLPALFSSFKTATPGYLKQRAIECIEMALTCIRSQEFLDGWDTNLETAAWCLLIGLDNGRPKVAKTKKSNGNNQLDDRMVDPDSWGKASEPNMFTELNE